MTVDSRIPNQKTNDGNILKKLATNQNLTEEEDNRLDELIRIAANNLGLKW